jgi:hypothetical protein
VGIDAGPQVAHEAVGLVHWFRLQRLGAKRHGGGVEAKPVGTQIEPERHDGPDLVHDGGGLDVEIGFEPVELVEVPRGARVIPGPDALLDPGEDRLRWAARRRIVGPDVVVEVGRMARARGAKPGVLVRGVLDDEVGDEADAARGRGLTERGEAFETAERGEAVA